MAAVALTLVVYDSIILIQTEYQTIWKSQWGCPKVLYYIIRLLAIPFLAVAAYGWIDFREALSNRFCQIWLPMVTVPMFLTFAASNWLFTLRLIALYAHRRTLVWFIRAFYVCTYAVTFSFVVLTLVTYQRVGIYYNTTSKVCTSFHRIPYSGPIFYTPALYEIFIFTLTAYRAHQDAILVNKANMRLLVVLYRDGAAAFFIMFCMRAWNIWVFATQPVSSLQVATNIFWAVNAVLTARIYLNIAWIVNQPSVTTHQAIDADLSWALHTTGSERYGRSGQLTPIINEDVSRPDVEIYP